MKKIVRLSLRILAVIMFATSPALAWDCSEAGINKMYYDISEERDKCNQGVPSLHCLNIHMYKIIEIMRICHIPAPPPPLEVHCDNCGLQPW
jgi:hypothetical protein